MESTSMDNHDVIIDILTQIRKAIENLIEWNQGISDMNSLLQSPGGMQDLAGNCMLIMAIGDGFKKIDKMTDNEFLSMCPDIPWRQVFGLRNRIAHGYFDIDIDIIADVLQNDLVPLLSATDYLINHIR